jgi:hypothetical protein
MPRGEVRLSLGELQSMMRRQTNRLSKLKRERAKLLTKLAGIDREIASIDGASGGGVRARNPKSLVATLESVLSRSGKPMAVGDIVAAVKATGYRSNSENFRAIVNQTLIKESRFAQASRGMYQLKK